MPLPIIFGAFKFVSLLSGVRKLVGAITKTAIENPKTTIAVILLAVGSWYLYNWAYDRGVASQQEQLTKLQGTITAHEARIEQQQAKITELEGDSKTEADKNKTIKDELETKLAGVTEEYKKLKKDRDYWKAQKKNREFIYVPGETPNNPIEVRLQGGKVVCDQYYDEYVDVINKMVQDTNTALAKARAK